MESFFEIFSVLFCIGYCMCPSLAGILVLFLAVFMGDVKREYREVDNENLSHWSGYYEMVNGFRKRQGKYPTWLIPRIERRQPKSDSLFDSISNTSEKTSKAISLYDQVENVLSHTPVSESKKASFETQSYQILFNLNKALWKQSRSWKIYLAIKHDTLQTRDSKKELEHMISALNQEIERSLDVLTMVSVSLLNVELAHGDAELDRLLNELNESNKRLRELSESYRDSKS